MTDRDFFAAAAITGLLANGDFTKESIPSLAFSMAEEMLKERAKTNLDAVPEARATEPESSVPPESGVAPANTQEPVAWAVIVRGERMYASLSKKNCEEQAYYYGLAASVVPLYRHPQPTLADAEREAACADAAPRATGGDVMQRNRGSTLVEADAWIEPVAVLAVAAILLTLVSLLWPADSAARSAAKRNGEQASPQPPQSWNLYTAQHDGHWFVKDAGGGVCHHPDCPCLSRTAERETQ